MSLIQAEAHSGDVISPETIQETIEEGLGDQFMGAKVLVLIPDHTRTIPLPQLFRVLTSVLQDVNQLDFMVALGTHPTLSDEKLRKLVGITQEEGEKRYKPVGLLNHTWDTPNTLVDVGIIRQVEVQEIAREVWHPSLGGDVTVRINRQIQEYDRVIILGPTFPHEVVGFSGGAKYFFPGISGPEMINLTHWLGALIGIVTIIGIKENPVRSLIHRAMEFIDMPVTLVGMVVVEEGLAGIYIGDIIEAWSASADLSAKRHIQWLDQPMKQVLSWAPPMYDELWTSAKAVYKLEPVIAKGGEIIIYAPHLEIVSRVHGKHIYAMGYHVLDFFLKQWDQYKHFPLAVLAHSTHVRCAGHYSEGVETPNVRVTLASKIPKEDCEKLNLGYQDPRTITPKDWEGREDDGILFVPRAGEMLYRLKE